MKYIVLFFIFIFGLSINAQDIERDGILYQVKNERIFLDGKDVTDTLKLEKKTAIIKQANIKAEKLKLQEKALKEEAKVKKEAKKVEKGTKKAKKGSR